MGRAALIFVRLDKRGLNGHYMKESMRGATMPMP